MSTKSDNNGKDTKAPADITSSSPADVADAKASVSPAASDPPATPSGVAVAAASEVAVVSAAAAAPDRAIPLVDIAAPSTPFTPPDDAPPPPADDGGAGPDESPAVEIEVEAAEDIPENERVYTWGIPGTDGYTLVVALLGATSTDQARTMALTYLVPLGRKKDDQGWDVPWTRPLNPVEANWVLTVEPKIVRATQSITLDHAGALEANEKLRRENEALETTKQVFADCGVDPNNPQEFIDRVYADASSITSARDSERDARHRRLVAALQDVQTVLTTAIDETGFAPIKPIPTAEPDYSHLTVVLDNLEDAKLYPRLDGANFVDRDLDTPYTADEAAGLEMILKDNGVLDEYWRTSCGPTQIDQVRAAMTRLKALAGL